MITLRKQGTKDSRKGHFSPCLLVALFTCLLIFPRLSLKLAREPGPQELMQQGHQALARGDYEGAIALYERAELHSTEPVEVAFYLAVAKYHLARKTEGVSPELQEAEQLFRCCLDPADPHRPRALCGLGNCLLHKAGESDAASLRAALTCYDQCLLCAGDDEELIADARYNREKARLLLQQFPPPSSVSPNERPPGEDQNPPPPRPERHQPIPMQVGETGSEGNTDPRSQPGGAKPDEGSATTTGNEPPQPGKGNLPPIPDQVDAPPLSPHDAAEHLQQAAQKVLQERQVHHRRSERPAASGVKDW